MTTLKDEEKKAMLDQQYNDWLKAGQELVKDHNASYWKVGDWYKPAYAGSYKDKQDLIAKAVIVTGFDKTTLRHYGEVAYKVKAGIRCPFLSFNHHRVIKDEKPERQKQLLTRATKERLTPKQLRQVTKGESITEGSGGQNQASEGRRGTGLRSPRHPEVVRDHHRNNLGEAPRRVGL
jgi:hypothetical protein